MYVHYGLRKGGARGQEAPDVLAGPALADADDQARKEPARTADGPDAKFPTQSATKR